MEDVGADGEERGVHGCVSHDFRVGIRAAVLLACITFVRDLFYVIGHAVPIIELFCQFQGLCLALMWLMEELQYRLDGSGG